MTNSVKRILALLTAALMLLSLPITASASAEDVPYNAFADYGQLTFDSPASEGVVIDGVVSKDEYACTPIEVNKDSEGMTWLDWTKEGFPEEELPEILPYSIKYYVTYDKDALYVAAEIVEASLYTRCDRLEDIWGLDSLEIDIAVDAYGDIEDGTYSQAFMLDRIRVTYALWDDGSGVTTPVGVCYTPSGYGVYQTNESMEEGTFMVTRDDDKQLTTYEMRFTWEELYCMPSVPNQVFVNFQLHLGDGRYLDYVQDGYIACLGGLRFACQLDDQAKAELGTDKSMALHIINLTDAPRLNGDVVEDTTAEETTEAPTEEITEAPTAEETTAEVTTEAPAEEATGAPTDAPAEKTGCGASVSMAALLVAACAAFACKARD